ncbi:hypothetical protein FRC02_009412 [Tulasnella sp. 418]|nr:hypothetical protein FRC02_009412 [Tulasnella sp. 418]
MIGPTSSFVPHSAGPNSYTPSGYFTQSYGGTNTTNSGGHDFSDQDYRNHASSVMPGANYDAIAGGYSTNYGPFNPSPPVAPNSYQAPVTMTRSVSYEGWSEPNPAIDATYMPVQHASPTSFSTGGRTSPEGVGQHAFSGPAQSFATLHQQSQSEGFPYSNSLAGQAQNIQSSNVPGYHPISPPRQAGQKPDSYPSFNAQNQAQNISPPRKIISNSRTGRTSLSQGPQNGTLLTSTAPQSSPFSAPGGSVNTHMTGSSVHSSQSYPQSLPASQGSLQADNKAQANQRKRPRHTSTNSLSVPKPSTGFQPQPSVGLEDYLTDSEDDSDDEPSVGGGSSGRAVRISEPKGKGKGKNANPDPTKRLPGACRNCKRLKMKCVFENDEDRTCKRCRDTGRECNVDGRKRRQPSNKREQLMHLLHEKDKLIDALLRRVYNPSIQRPFAASQVQSQSQPTTPGGGQLQPPPSAANSTAQDIQAWLANSARAKPYYRSPYKSGRSIASAEEESSDEEEAMARSAMVKSERETSVPVSDWSGMDSASQRGGRTREEGHELADFQSSASSSNVHSRRLSSGEMKLIAIPDETAPQGLLAVLSLESMTLEERQAEKEKQRKRLTSASGSSAGSGVNQASGDGDQNRQEAGASEVDTRDNEAVDGVANKAYYNPGLSANLERRREAIEQEPPAILTTGLVTLEDVDELFKIFFDRLNVFVSILDPVLHTPATVYGRCPFLYTVICAISSRYHTKKPHLYRVLMHFAKVAASTSLTDGWKSIEICQAYLLMSVYQLPARRWEEDRSWLYLRLAIGMATDLSLHQPVKVTKFLNETHEREILNRERTWINLFNLDRSGATQFGKAPSIKEDSIIRHPGAKYRNELLPFLVNYSRLVVFSFGFQQTYQQGLLQSNNMFLNGCLDAAMNVVKIVVENLAPTGYLRYAADGHFVFAAFASGFLLRVLQPQIACHLEPDQLHRIRTLINRLIKVLASPEVAVDERHTPKLYSRFLEGLVQKRTQEAATRGTESAINGAPSTTTAPPRPPQQPSRIITQDQSVVLAPIEHPLSPTIEVQPPDEDMNGMAAQHHTILFNPLQPGHELLGPEHMLDDGTYAYSTTASSTVDGVGRDMEMDYGGALTQGDENWIASMGAVDNPAFWSTMLMPGFTWPSPEMPWPAPITPEASQNGGGYDVGSTQGMQSQQSYSNMLNMSDVLGSR